MLGVELVMGTGYTHVGGETHPPSYQGRVPRCPIHFVFTLVSTVWMWYINWVWASFFTTYLRT